MLQKFGYYVYFHAEKEGTPLAYDCFLTSGTSRGTPKKILKWSCGASLEDVNLAIQCDLRFYLFNKKIPYLTLRKKRASFAKHAKTLWKWVQEAEKSNPGSRKLVSFGEVAYDKKEDVITIKEA